MTNQVKEEKNFPGEPAKLLAAYTEHPSECEWWGAMPKTKCDCGLTELLNEIEKPVEQGDAAILYQALENLYGDIYLMGLCEITFEDICVGSARDALKALKKLQKWRERPVYFAIGQRAGGRANNEESRDIGD